MIHKLRDSKDYLPEISRVAELDGQIVGVIMYHKERIVDGDKETEIISFGPLAVEPTCFNMGIRGKLLKETLAWQRKPGISASHSAGNRTIILNMVSYSAKAPGSSIIFTERPIPL